MAAPGFGYCTSRFVNLLQLAVTSGHLFDGWDNSWSDPHRGRTRTEDGSPVMTSRNYRSVQATEIVVDVEVNDRAGSYLHDHESTERDSSVAVTFVTSLLFLRHGTAHTDSSKVTSNHSDQVSGQRPTEDKGHYIFVHVLSAERLHLSFRG